MKNKHSIKLRSCIHLAYICIFVVSSFTVATLFSESNIIVQTNEFLINENNYKVIGYYEGDNPEALHLGVESAIDKSKDYAIQQIAEIAVPQSMLDYYDVAFSSNGNYFCLLIKRTHPYGITQHVMLAYRKDALNKYHLFKSQIEAVSFSIEGVEYEKDEIHLYQIEQIIQTQIRCDWESNDKSLPRVTIFNINNMSLFISDNDELSVTGILNNVWSYKLPVLLNVEAEKVQFGTVELSKDKDVQADSETEINVQRRPRNQ